MIFEGYFGHFKVSRLFLSIFRLQGYFGHFFRFWGVFWSFLGFNVVLINF